MYLGRQPTTCTDRLSQREQTERSCMQQHALLRGRYQLIFDDTQSSNQRCRAYVQSQVHVTSRRLLAEDIITISDMHVCTGRHVHKYFTNQAV